MTADTPEPIGTHVPAKDYFFAEVLAALPEHPHLAASIVEQELARKHHLASIASTWRENGHQFDTGDRPETQWERSGGFGYCVRCGHLVHKEGRLSRRASTTCSPARIELRQPTPSGAPA
ncbi:hypothetical protein [Curtobacterium sp. MCSS17_016]|uniref:hypothetical protein n=1 Tax=Curtobacterium sp. MCSS17_016 TaxID=2175644 RepID=UPI000DA6E70E|nr:hypothetical protein [Curtobacterium sp. MCSS17_016]WIE81533.1 hypothetical protein DEJ19_020050 [Curtobacterium sp. MCSS17_016]